MSRRDQLLSRVEVSNFKSIRHADLELRQLTVLVGENSAGKSSLIQAMFLLAQVVRGRTRPDVVSLNGMELNLGNFNDVLHTGAPGESIRLGLAVDADAVLMRRQRDLGTTTARFDLFEDETGDPLYASDDARWSVTLGEPVDELGVASIEKIEVTDSLEGVTLEVIPNQDSESLEEVEELYERSRRLGLIRNTRAGRSRLVSDVVRATRFKGTLNRLQDGRAIETEEVFPAVAVDSGFPIEIYALEAESHALAQRWIELVVIRTELRRRDRGAESRPSLRDLRRARRVGGPELNFEPGRTAEELFPAFSRWVDTLDRYGAEESVPQEVEPLSEDRLVAVVGFEDSIAWGLRDLLESRRSDRGAIAPQPSSTIDIANGLSELLYGSVHYLGPLREDPSPSYRPGQGGGVATLGMKGEFHAAALETYRNLETLCPRRDGDPRAMPLGAAVDYWVEQFGVARSVTPHDMGRPGIELMLVDPQTGDDRDPTAVGVGVSQVLPVIVLCLLARPGELILLEQPELHLHPAPQQIMGDFLLGIAESGRQLIVETHSEYLINRLRLRIAEDEYGSVAELIRIWYAKRDDGRTRFELLDPNRFGSFDEWPEGFFDQAPREAEQILRAAARKRRADRPPSSEPGAPASKVGATSASPSPDVPSGSPESWPQMSSTSPIPSDLERHIRRHAPAHLVPYELEYARRCILELELELRRPGSGARSYVNLYPVRRGRRASAFEPRSGRVEIYCRPDDAGGYSHAQIVTNKGEPHAVKVYLDSDEAVRQAVELTMIGLRER